MDLGVSGKSDKLVFMLMYEYASSIEKLTKGNFTAIQVIDKLESQMGKFSYQILGILFFMSGHT